MDVGERIKYFRTAKGYSVNKLANLSGISQSYVRDVELGNKNPTVEIISIICDTLNISLQEFFSDENSQSFLSDPLLAEIYSLNDRQRKALTCFLESLKE
jgi:transcriptional regulator with XRE-family HTH domain